MGTKTGQYKNNFNVDYGTKSNDDAVLFNVQHNILAVLKLLKDYKMKLNIR